MLPVLLDAPILKMYTFGVFLLLAFFWSLFWFWRNIKRTSFKEDEMFDGLFISLFGALFVARLVHVLVHFQDFGPSILKFILINGYPGLSLPGALLGGFLTLRIFTKYMRLPFMEVVAYAVPPLFLALGIGKLGAFFAGTSIGSLTSFPLHVAYMGYTGLRHIVGVYEAIILFIGFYVSQKMLLNYRRDKIDVGSLFSFFIGVVALAYIVLDFLKADAVYLFSVRFNVAVATLFLITVLGWEGIKYRKNVVAAIRKLRASTRKNDTITKIDINPRTTGEAEEEAFEGLQKNPGNDSQS